MRGDNETKGNQMEVITAKITKLELRRKLQKAMLAGKHREGGAIALHAWPRRRHGDHWCAVGPVVWGESAVSWFDIRCPDTEYYRVNRMLADVCRELGLPYMNMA